jgi:hypothetical protein
LLFGFSFDDGGGDLGAILQGVQGSLAQIQQSLAALAQQLNGIEQTLLQLPSIIAGIVDAEFATEWLTTTRAKVGDIKDKTLDGPTYDANRLAVDRLVDDLGEAIRQVWQFTHGGATAATLTCGPLGVWAQAKSLVLLDPILNPSHPSLRQMALYIEMKQSFDALLGSLSAARTNAQVTSTNTPHPPGGGGWTFNATTGLFVQPSAPPGDFDQVYLTSESDANTLWGSVMPTATPPPQLRHFQVVNSVTIPKANWIDRQNVSAAYSAWPSALELFQEADRTLKYLVNFDKARSDIAQVFV